MGVFPQSSRIMCVRRDSGVKTLARMQARQLDLLDSVQTTLLAARRVQAQRCQTNERSQFLLVVWHAQKQLWQNGTSAAAGAGRRAHRWPPDNRQTSTLPRRTSFASSGADLKPSSSFQTAPNGYSTSQEPERTFSAAVADALDAWAPGDVATQQHAPCTIGKGNATYRRGRPRTALTSGELALRRRVLSRRRRLGRRRRREGDGICK